MSIHRLSYNVGGMKILGIETSCDETAAAVVENGTTLLSNIVASSLDLHVAYGGVVPEVAARSHLEHINPVTKSALLEARCSWEDIDSIAVTQGPGLGGSLLVGNMTARTLSLLHDLPLYAINHVEAHVYASFIANTGLKNYNLPKDSPKFPLLALIVSGGHSQLVLFKNHGKYIVLGQTRDDAVGEAFDKVAKIIGLPYPGGPSIQQASKNGNTLKYDFPIAKLDNPYDFSFSGLKTAVLRQAQTTVGKDFSFPSYKVSPLLSDQNVFNIAASFQKTAIDTFKKKTEKAIGEYRPKSLVIAGGVAANRSLRNEFNNSFEIPIFFPDIKLCTDNAAMIASNAFFRLKHGLKPSDPYHTDIEPSLSM